MAHNESESLITDFANYQVNFLPTETEWMTTCLLYNYSFLELGSAVAGIINTTTVSHPILIQ